MHRGWMLLYQLKRGMTAKTYRHDNCALLDLAGNVVAEMDDYVIENIDHKLAVFRVQTKIELSAEHRCNCDLQKMVLFVMLLSLYGQELFATHFSIRPLHRSEYGRLAKVRDN
ncbi:hypothetical protein Y032_0408g914 [Ancylostoma ceylanicum]|uniref:Uncharacterized protein n=1 Tax=Ancylostoma ceylanicum TaxID=53326 RepID=A0A016X3I0_9BILA|nr:hypothetical protein Y032_0408g914 [Ancylostoma ceylanicum]